MCCFHTQCWPAVCCSTKIKKQDCISQPLWRKTSFSTILINVEMCFLNYEASSSLWKDETCSDLLFAPECSFCPLSELCWVYPAHLTSSDSYPNFGCLVTAYLNLLLWISDINCVPLEILTMLLFLGKSDIFCNVVENKLFSVAKI